MKFEYKQQQIYLKSSTSWGLFSSGKHHGIDESSIKYLNKLGEEGWELVTILNFSYGSGGSPNPVGLFKRQKVEN